MIKIENTEVFGWEAAIRGMRNPLNSWDKSDSYDWEGLLKIGGNDLDLMKRLVVAGSDHRKFLRMINVTCDITAPLYWRKEFDTYEVGTTANSCSTMHMIHTKPFELDDFSHDRLLSDPLYPYSPQNILSFIIEAMNFHREQFLKTKNKVHWWQMIQLLPTSYNQRRTVQMNYEVRRNIYRARKEHKLDEWCVMCAGIEVLPYSELIVGC